MRMRRIALLTTVFAVAACSSYTAPTYHEDTYPIAPRHLARFVTIGYGRYASAMWSMRAAVDAEGQLCLGMRWRPSSSGQDDGCGFGSNTVNDYGRMTEPVDTSESASGSWLAFGPSPVRPRHPGEWREKR